MAQETSPKLTAKQQKFVQEYLIDLNATQAAIRAGYSQKTAEQIGYQLLQKTSVQQAVQRGAAKVSQKAEVDAAWLLKRLAEEADADIADLYNEKGGLKPVKEWPRVWRTGLVAGIKSKQEFDYVDGEKVPDGIVHELKLSERVRRLELIGKHIAVGAFAERIEHTGKDGGPIETIDITDNERARRIAFALEQGMRSPTEH